MNHSQKKTLLSRIFFSQCDALAVGVWSCPTFILLLMWLVFIPTILLAYVFTGGHQWPEFLTLTIILITVFLVVITYMLIRAFNIIASIRKLDAAQVKNTEETKDQFVYLAVHDLATPATAVKWGIRILDQSTNKSLTPDEHEIIDNIRAKNEELIILIRQILLISRIDRGLISPRVEFFPLSEFLKKQIKTFWEDNRRNNTSFTVDISETIPDLVTDSELLEEIFKILLYNAQSHSSQVGGRMAIIAKTEGDNAVISIENNGEGIPLELQQHLFEKFWINDKTKTVERSGFGLFIAKGLARVLGGDISFSSDAAITRFTLKLPINTHERIAS